MNPRQIYNRLLWAEMDGSLATDCRRMVSAERHALHVAFESKNPEQIRKAAAEALRVARMWGVIE